MVLLLTGTLRSLPLSPATCLPGSSALCPSHRHIQPRPFSGQGPPLPARGSRPEVRPPQGACLDPPAGRLGARLQRSLLGAQPFSEG